MDQPAGASDSQMRTDRLNGGLEATILHMGRSRDTTSLSVSLRIRNTGKAIAYLAIIGHQVNVIDNSGVHFDYRSVNGIANCKIGPSDPPAACLGIPGDFYQIPMQSFTRLDPSTPDAAGSDGIIVNLTFSTNGPRSEGPFISLSGNMFYRLVKDADVDDTLSERDQYKQFRLMSLSFPPQLVTESR
jgi:hypothetical protein